MPHSLRIFRTLKAAGLSEEQSLCIAEVVEDAKTEPAIYDREEIIDLLCEAHLTEDLAEVLTDVLRNCFYAQRFSTHFDKSAFKVRLVRSKMSASIAAAFLDALEPCVTSPHTAEIRQPVLHQQSAGRVVMCDFTFLKKPEMQKERRAIVVSARSANATGRCAVIPVSKQRAAVPNALHYEFRPGTYNFFHRTEPVWAVCDHIYTVSLERLWMINVNHRPHPAAQISPQHLADIRNLLGTALGVER